jgi:hypothetical protein
VSAGDAVAPELAPETYAAPAGLDALSPVLRTKIERFADLLLERNASVNLTAARSREAIFEHVRDSLTIAPYLSEPFADIGSGGGFPAIPLAIATGYRGALIEAVAKKARFLDEVFRWTCGFFAPKMPAATRISGKRSPRRRHARSPRFPRCSSSRCRF